MNQTVQIKLTSFPVTIIVKSFREEAGTLYELTETSRWFSPTCCARETKSLFVRSLDRT